MTTDEWLDSTVQELDALMTVYRECEKLEIERMDLFVASINAAQFNRHRNEGERAYKISEFLLYGKNEAKSAMVDITDVPMITALLSAISTRKD